MVEMAGQPRVVHPPYGRLRGQEFGDPLAARTDLPHRHRKCLDPALHQPGFVRGGRRAQHADVPADRGAHLFVGGDDRAAGDVGVAAQVLGGGVDHQVGAQRDGLLQVRRGESAVHHQQRAGPVRQVGDGGNIGDLQQRVRRGLGPHQRGFRPDRGGHRVQVTHVHRGVGQAPPLVDVMHQVPGCCGLTVARGLPTCRGMSRRAAPGPPGRTGSPTGSRDRGPRAGRSRTPRSGSRSARRSPGRRGCARSGRRTSRRARRRRGAPYMWCSRSVRCSSSRS